jgi:transposase
MMTTTGPDVFAGVDTHADFHHAAIIDDLGRELADRRFPATMAGFTQLIEFLTGAGEVVRIAVEGTNSYGAGLTRRLLEHGFTVLETTPGDKADRRLRGKTDAADAYTAARAAASGRASATPKDSTGDVEAIRVLQVTRRLAVRQQTQLMNQIKALLVTAPIGVRERFAHRSRLQLARALAATRLVGADSVQEALLSALKIDARRWLELRQTQTQLTSQIRALVQRTASELIEVPGVGPDTAAALLIATGQNAHRVTSEAALARLFGIAPIQASSGRTLRHRLDRGGNRQGNAAVHRIALVRLAHEPRTKDYLTRCLSRGKTKREAMRLLKRHLVRELYPVLATLH